MDLTKVDWDQNKQRYKDRDEGKGTIDGWIGGSTLRAFTKIDTSNGLKPKEVIRPLFVDFGESLDNFIRTNPRINREDFRKDFDKFHEREVIRFQKMIKDLGIKSRARGGEENDFDDDSSYNAFAKVLNLIHTHWCHREGPKGFRKGRHPIGSGIDECLHVPIDKRVIDKLKPHVIIGNLPSIPAPMFGNSKWPSTLESMGDIREKVDYVEFQKYFREIADEIGLSPVEAFEGFW